MNVKRLSHIPITSISRNAKVKKQAFLTSREVPSITNFAKVEVHSIKNLGPNNFVVICFGVKGETNE